MKVPEELPDGWHLFADARMSAPEFLAVAGGEAAVFSARSPGKPTANEDTAFVATVGEREGILAVADGAGGLPLGHEASLLAVTALAASLAERTPGEPLREAIARAFDRAHRAVLGLAAGAATTMHVLSINKGRLRSFHVGDSQAIVAGQRGKRKLVTVAHSPVGFAFAAGLLAEKDALVHHERHLVSNLLGIEQPRVEMSGPVELAARDTVVVASDGLFDNFTIDEIVRIVASGPLKAAVQRLVTETGERMTVRGDDRPSKPDDLSLIVFRSARPPKK